MNHQEVLAELRARLEPTRRSVGVLFKSYSGDAYLANLPRIECVDGFSLSVQASHVHYCAPRDSAGPWQKVEVGFPSAKVDALMPYIDGGQDDDPTDAVYGYVPIEIVADTILTHGGFAP